MIDVIIVNYQSTDYLLRCLKSVYDSNKEIPIKVYIQNNDFNNGIDRISNAFPKANIIKNRHNIGFSKAVNNAIKQSNAPYVLLLNPDTYVVGDFFGSVLNYMEKHPDVGILGPKIINSDGTVQGSARSFPTPLTALTGRSSLLTKWFPNNRFSRTNILTTDSDGKTTMEANWVSGACMLIRRDAIEDVGYMDERFFLYWEDADWCRRMWRRGWKVVYYQPASIIHYIGGSSSKIPFQSFLAFHKSSYKLFAKYARWPLNILKPIAPFGLALRMIFIAYLYLAEWPFTTIKRHHKYKKSPAGRLPAGKIKILRVISRLNIGGPTIHVKILSEELNTNIFTSTLISGKISAQEGDMLYLFDSMNQKPFIIPELKREINFRNDIKSFYKISKIIYQLKPDIVDTHTAKAGFITRIIVFTHNLIYAKRIKTVHTFHGHVFKEYFSENASNVFVLIERILSKFTDKIITVSDSQKKELNEEYRIAPADKIKTIELGFDLKPFVENKGSKGKFRQKLGLDNDTLLIGIVGRLVPIKNHKMLLKAAKIFIQQNPSVRVAFIVIGDGELRNELETYCQNQSLAKHVIFCGWVKDVASVYVDLDVLALTSLNEGTPVSIIEAMASSVPVIATDVGGVADMLGQPVGNTHANGFKICERGILCRKNDGIGFLAGLQWLIENRDIAGDELVDRAKSFVEEHYSDKRLIHDMEKFYTGLVRSKR
ncbi:glycosyltransferase [Thermodesulfobacteriota bacterium]